MSFFISLKPYEYRKSRRTNKKCNSPIVTVAYPLELDPIMREIKYGRYFSPYNRAKSMHILKHYSQHNLQKLGCFKER